MSWMDSWSRPNKSSATPPPLYLTDENVKYCAACGRVIGARKSHKQNEVVKYCSDSCRKRRLKPLDKKIDSTILALLSGQEDSGIEKIDVKSRYRKGDRRNMITCDEIEAIVFDRKVAAVKTPDEQTSDEFEEDPYASEKEIPAGDLQGKPPNPTGPGSEEKRQEGQKRAEEREMVRRAARRAVVFGFPLDEKEEVRKDGKTKPAADQRASSDEAPRRKCEALMNGHVVEPSFAKGNWSIRWRE
ncbi:hypothetical protein PMZ80_002822 [Knufia obscura]|uniref:Uncharacterized protein n=2 Tax=Knufia TaxID=430999 RepID=A0AAN8ECW5_9EURO|nr:hypothetical protein PMZ80_002822 [Knufia obscura]KAK5948413.1 hypothetical protein OHC33_010587 [Knufia fluminis]